MRIYDRVSKHQLDEIVLYLTPADAKQLSDFAAQLAECPDHAHVLDSSLRREVTLVVYTDETLPTLDPESQAVICDGSD